MRSARLRARQSPIEEWSCFGHKSFSLSHRFRRTQLPSNKFATAYWRHPIWLHAHRLEKGLRSMLCTVVFYSWLRVVCSAFAKQWLPSVNKEQLKATKASITTLDSPTGCKSSPENIFQQRRRRQQQTAEQREHRLAKRRQPRQQDTEERQRQKTNKQTNKQLPRCKRNRWRELGNPSTALCKISVRRSKYCREFSMAKNSYKADRSIHARFSSSEDWFFSFHCLS